MVWIRAVILGSMASMLFTGCALGDKSPTEASNRILDRQALAAAVEDLRTRTGIPGIAMEIVSSTENWTYVSGLADVESNRPVSEKDVFPFLSITKSAVISVVLELEDEGVINLNDPIGYYVPDVPWGDQITVRQLAGMRSGLSEYTQDPTLQAAIDRDPARVFTDEELIRLGLDQPMKFAPGTSYEYSNTNTLLLGQLIQSVTGHRWDEEVSQRLVEPLQLGSIVYPGATSIGEPSARPYFSQPEKGAPPKLLPLISSTAYSASGGLTGTIKDLSRWISALKTSNFLSNESAEARLAEVSQAQDGEPFYDEYGLGIGKVNGWIGHTGSGVGYQNLAMYNPNSGTTIAIMMNSQTETPDMPAHFLQTIQPLVD